MTMRGHASIGGKPGRSVPGDRSRRCSPSPRSSPRTEEVDNTNYKHNSPKGSRYRCRDPNTVQTSGVYSYLHGSLTGL
jgi:hypothetical protein